MTTDIRALKAGASVVDTPDYNDLIDELLAGAGVGTITEVTSNDDSVTVTNPHGPIVDLSAGVGSRMATANVLPESGTLGDMLLFLGDDDPVPLLWDGTDWVQFDTSPYTPPELPGPGLTLLDDFNRADSATLDANWGHPSVGSAEMRVNGSMAIFAVGGAESTSIWTADLFGSDQAVEITVPITDGFGAHIYLLLQVAAVAPAAFTGYLVDLVLGPSTLTVDIYRASAGSYSTVTSGLGPFTNAAGDIWTLSKIGAVLTLERNGVSVATPTDSSPLVGNGYAGIGGRGSTIIKLDDFKAGSL